MTIIVKHLKVSTIPDDPDTDLVRPTDWNDDHDISGLGTMAEQDASNVAITGGTISGLSSPLDVSSGGTGATDLTGYVVGNGTSAFTTTATIPNTDVSGLGTMSTQNATNVNITGGSISGTSIDGYVPDARTITAGTGLDGGGDLTADRTISLADTTVVADTYGSATQVPVFDVNAQGQITGVTDTAIAIPTSQITDAGTAFGAATLDSSGKVPTSQLPPLGGLAYQGSWNASTNTPTLASGVGTNGYYYVVSVAGTTNLDGITDWLVGDWAIFNGTAWQKIDNTDGVTSVNSYTGAVVLTYSDVGAQPAGTYVTSVGGTSPISSSGGTTPSVSISQAGVASDGYLSSTDWNTFNGKGSVSSVAATAGTGISVTGSPITSSGTLTITNTAPDQTVTLTSGTGISATGTYPNFTITNTAPDQVVTLTEGGTTTITGTYPNFTISSSDQYSGTVTSVGTGTGLSGGPITSSGTISFSNTAVGTWAATPSSANLAAAMSDETGSGSLVFGTGPTLSAPVIDGTNPYIQFNNGSAVTVAAGKLWYDGSTGSWNAGMGGGNITQQIGEELFVYGKASSAITDSPLQIIYQTGTVGASGTITFAPTTTGITNGDTIIGVATESIALNGFGRVTSFGVIHGITTNGTAFGETWADGDTIWYNPVTGNPTNIKPVAPNIKVSVGTVINAGSGGSGSFQVEINHGSVLGGTDSNVQLSSVSNGNILTYNGAGSYWKNTDLTAGTGISVSKASDGTLTIANTSPSSGGTVTSVATGTGLSGGPITTSGTISLANTTVSAGSYTNSSITVDAQGRLTSASSGTAPVTSVTGTSPIVSSGGTTPAISLANTAVTPGSYTNTNLTVDAQGRITAASSGSAGGVTSFSAGTTGLTPNTGTTGAVTLAGTLAIGNGGTGQTTASAAFNALSPITTAGDLIIGNGSNSATRLAIGANTYVLTSNGTTATWAAPAAGGSVAGSNTQIQYNNSGAFGASANFTYVSGTGSLTAPQVVASNGIVVNNKTVGTSYSIPSGYSASSVGPVSVSSGVSVTIPSGSRWVVL